MTKSLACAGMALLMAAAAVVSLSAFETAGAATREVQVGDNFYSDAVSMTSMTTIDVGDTVNWTWVGSLPHSVTSDTGVFDSNPPSGSQTSGTFSFTFNTAGTFEYFCRIHSTADGSGMNGTVVVQAAQQATATNTSAAATNTPGGATNTPAPATSTPAAGTATTAAATATPTRGTINGAEVTATATRTSGAGAGAQLPRTGNGAGSVAASSMSWLAVGLAVTGALALAGSALANRRSR